VKQSKYEPWSRTELITTVFSVLFLSSVFGYAVLIHYPKSFTMSFTVKQSMILIGYSEYTQVVTTSGFTFYLYDYPALGVGGTYTFELMSGKDSLFGSPVYDVVERLK